MSLRGKTLFITGASRGIGHAIAMRAARDGANVTIAAKSAQPHPKLAGTIYSAATDVEAAGGRALPCMVDVRDEASVQAAVDATVRTFGGIDIVVNNASAISLASVGQTEMKRYDLMQQINVRGTYLVSKLALPHLRKASNPHVLTLSPPLELSPRWFSGHVAYTLSKYGMSMCMLGMAAEFAADGIACNALWPRYGVATAAIEFAVGSRDELRRCYRPEMMADAAYVIFRRPARQCTGNFFLDDRLLYEEGERDFGRYRIDPGTTLRPGMFVSENDRPPPGIL
jgi:citronellol/citronellal dehydrogenase